MSMMASYVEVPADRLADLLDNPEAVAGLFHDEVPLKAPAAINEQVAGAAAGGMPQMLVNALLRLDPTTLKAMEQRLKSMGIGLADLRSDKGREVLLNLMRTLPAASASMGARGGPAPTTGGARLSLDKAWHGIHYLLSSAAEPGPTLISNVVLGGTEIGDDDMGYGPARYFAPPDTVAMANALSAPLLQAEMRARFDPAVMLRLEIYPGGWTARELDWLMDEYGRLREFFEQAATRQSAVFTCLV